MSRPVSIWILFGFCLAVLLAAMGWLSLAVLRLDRVEAQSHQRAELEEKLRLAFWRMDSFLTPLIVEESARPYFVYDSSHTVGQAHPGLPSGLGEIRIPSPLVSLSSSNVLLHFQFDGEGRLSSPQAPPGTELPDEAGLPSRTNLAAAARLNELREILGQAANPSRVRGALSSDRPMSNGELLSQLCAGPSAGPVRAMNLAEASMADRGMGDEPAFEQRRRLEQQQVSPRNERLSVENQMLRNSLEWRARANVYQQAAVNLEKGGNPAAGSGLNVVEEMFQPFWIDSILVLARRVAVNGQVSIQGCWLNWPELERSLLATIEDLFPEARLEPIVAPNEQNATQRLAFLPARLIVPAPRFAGLSFWSPIRISLAVAWGCALVAALSVAFLLHGVVSLSERRADFVSAVTHELRTPLTTFKMYSEMLARGMAPKEKQRQYLDTLCSEANRLSHLVENVLAFARLERGGIRSRVEKLTVSELLERVTPRLARRAGEAGMALTVDSPGEDGHALVRVNVAAVEQILFNLVDNACKYAGPGAGEKTIHLEAARAGGRAMLRVRDHGQGISREAARRLFRPFSKSAREAAQSAPGVGLGLALCRRLSRAMGGDLRLEGLAEGGACFILRLPVCREGGTGFD